PCTSALPITTPPPPLLPSLSLHDALPISDSFLPSRHQHTSKKIAGRANSFQFCAEIFLGNRAIERCDRGDFLVAQGRNHFAKIRSEEHTSELQSLRHLVCRLLLEKKKHVL